jgi:carbamoyltransferase
MSHIPSLGHDARVIALGINGFSGSDHDAAAAVVVDGQVVAAVEEERLNRRRHAPGDRPLEAVPEALRLAGVKAGDVDVVAHGWQPAALGLGVDEDSERACIREALASVGAVLDPQTPIHFVDHHVAHFWSGIPFLPPGASRTAVDALVVDGAGESTSGAAFRLRDGRLEKRWNLGLAGSLGLFYEAATAAVGFGTGNEGKTMGLASYGRAASMDDLPALPDDRFTGPIPALADRDQLRLVHRTGVRAIRSLVAPGASFNRRADLALGAQAIVEARVLGFLGEDGDPAPVLVMAGGVALNCTVNAAVARWCADRGITLTIPPPANDGGIAIGAAVAVSDDPPSCRADGAWLGRDWTAGEIAGRLAGLGVTATDVTAGELADHLLERDAVIGWFQGRAEVGPRALGRRAVLARPDSVRIRDRVNVLKGRESWRPLAPSVLPEEFALSFTGTPSPYMLVNATATAAGTRRLPGVVHVDNTARPQLVRDAPDDPYAAVLRELHARSGLGAVTCTSFNPGGEPIVHTPEQAYRAAVTMGLDLLAGDGWCVRLPRR